MSKDLFTEVSFSVHFRSIDVMSKTRLALGLPSHFLLLFWSVDIFFPFRLHFSSGNINMTLQQLASEAGKVLHPTIKMSWQKQVTSSTKISAVKGSEIHVEWWCFHSAKATRIIESDKHMAKKKQLSTCSLIVFTQGKCRKVFFAFCGNDCSFN